MKSIQHNLELVKPTFQVFIRSIDPSISSWIQYDSIRIQGDSIFLRFKSSKALIWFDVYAGVYREDVYMAMKASRNEMHEYFREIKLNVLNSK